MEDVTFESDDLLDEEQVCHYLSAVAPVPYRNHFIFSSKIKEFAKDNGFKIDEYRVLVNGTQIFKPYGTILYEGSVDKKSQYDQITDVQFKIFNSPAGKPIAWLWYGICKFEKNIPVVNEMRCIRLRKENIQIGDENAIGSPRFFKEPRGSGYFVGEVFAVDKGLIPNGRRDYFKPLPATKQFEEVLHLFFYQELYELYHYASKVRSAQKAVANFRKMEEAFNDKSENAGFIDSDEREAAQKELDEERGRAEKAEREIANRKKDTEENEVYKRVFTAIENTYKPAEPAQSGVGKKSEKSDRKQNKYMTQNLSKFKSKDQKLIARIYGIIKNILPKDMADLVIKKIQEELSK